MTYRSQASGDKISGYEVRRLQARYLGAEAAQRKAQKVFRTAKAEFEKAERALDRARERFLSIEGELLEANIKPRQATFTMHADGVNYVYPQPKLRSFAKSRFKFGEDSGTT